MYSVLSYYANSKKVVDLLIAFDKTYMKSTTKVKITICCLVGDVWGKNSCNFKAENNDDVKRR
jgi:hypothetical protein